MLVWRFTPAAKPDDPRWLNGPIWNWLLVRAPTSGEARLVASKWEAVQMGHDAEEGAAGNTAMSYQSALADPTLYDLTETSANDDGPASVIESSGRVDLRK